MYDNRMSYYLVIPGDRWEGWQTKEWIGIKWYIKLAALTKNYLPDMCAGSMKISIKSLKKKIWQFFFAKLLPNVVIVRAFTVENYNNNLFPLL